MVMRVNAAIGNKAHTGTDSEGLPRYSQSHNKVAAFPTPIHYALSTVQL